MAAAAAAWHGYFTISRRLRHAGYDVSARPETRSARAEDYRAGIERAIDVNNYIVNAINRAYRDVISKSP